MGVRDGFIDVELAVPLDDLAAMRKKGQNVERELIERLRDHADVRCSMEENAELRLDRAPEFHSAMGVDPKTGRDVFLAAARFAVIAPDSVFPSRDPGAV